MDHTQNEMVTFAIPSRAEVSESNQALFDTLESGLGFVPNLYAYFAKNDTALGDYLSLENRRSGLRAKEREVIDLVTSEINGCRYCQSAHTEIGKMNGFSADQILEIRKGRAPFDQKLDALVIFTAAVVKGRGKDSTVERDAFLDAGYSEADMIDVLMVIGGKTISNYVHNLTGFEIDFPLAEYLESSFV